MASQFPIQLCGPCPNDTVGITLRVMSNSSGDAAKANGELREQLDPDAVADWLVRVAQMLLMDHLAGGQHDARTDRRATLRNFVIPGILSPTAADTAMVPRRTRSTKR